MNGFDGAKGTWPDNISQTGSHLKERLTQKVRCRSPTLPSPTPVITGPFGFINLWIRLVRQPFDPDLTASRRQLAPYAFNRDGAVCDRRLPATKFKNTFFPAPQSSDVVALG
jgi:hypothetical protein